MKKLNNKGFSFHIVLPILALLAVGSIGAYMTFKSSAAVPPEGWKTIKTVSGPWTLSSKGKSIKPAGGTITASSNVKYRICVYAKYSKSASLNNIYMASQVSTAIAPRTIQQNIPYGPGTTYKTVCTTGVALTGGKSYLLYAMHNASGGGTLSISKIYWQRYY